MLELAAGWGGGPVRAREMAVHQEVSKKYLERIITMLMKAGLVLSVKGARGGYVLARHPARIRVLDVYEVLEGPLRLVECTGNPGVCRRHRECITRKLWIRTRNAARRVLASTTLAALAGGKA